MPRPRGWIPDGGRIRELRTNNNLTAEELATEIFRMFPDYPVLHPNSLMQIENGRPASGPLMGRIAATLGVPVRDIAWPPGKAPEGWGYIASGERRAHYYRAGRALCGRAEDYDGPLDADGDMPGAGCAACRRKLGGRADGMPRAS